MLACSMLVVMCAMSSSDTPRLQSCAGTSMSVDSGLLVLGMTEKSLCVSESSLVCVAKSCAGGGLSMVGMLGDGGLGWTIGTCCGLAGRGWCCLA